MVNMGRHAVKMSDDGWTALTADGSASAHFEHTVIVTDDGPEILSVPQGKEAPELALKD